MSRLYRFLLRLWGTRKAPCAATRLRWRIVWATTYDHCVSYRELAEELAESRP